MLKKILLPFVVGAFAPVFIWASESSQDVSIKINQEGDAISVKSAELSKKDGKSELRMKLKRKDYAPIPFVNHLHIDVYDDEDALLKSYVEKVSTHQFRRSATGRYRAKYIGRKVYANSNGMAAIQITAINGTHDKACM